MAKVNNRTSYRPGKDFEFYSHCRAPALRVFKCQSSFLEGFKYIDNWSKSFMELCDAFQCFLYLLNVIISYAGQNHFTIH